VAGLSAAAGLHTLAEDEGADLIVVGSTERGRAGRTLPGTTADRLLNGAPCAVAVVPLGYRGEATDALQRIGIAYCASPEATSALEVARAIAEAAGAALTVVSAFDRDGLPMSEDVDAARRAAEACLDRALAKVSEGVDVDGELIEGDAVHVLRERSEALDLLVTGSRAYGPLRRTLVGSVSPGLLVDCLCPVLVVPRGTVQVAEPLA
jgi:nucleotide-binding universal stress UspA family protein